MNKMIIILSAILIAVTLLPALTLEQVYPKIENAYGKLESWQANLTQVNYFAQTKSTLRSSGKFYYRQANAAIHYDKPSVQSIIVESGKVTVYDKANKTAFKTAFNSPLQSLNPVKIVRAYWRDSDKKLVKSGKGQTQVFLKPKKDKNIREITFTLDDAAGHITSLTYKDKQGNAVTLTFTGIRVNKPIPDSVWKLDLPKDVRVIER